MLYLSNFDVCSDGIVAYDYIAGATYFYVLNNDTYYQEIIKLNCTVNYDTVVYNEFYGIYGWVSSTPFRFLFVYQFYSRMTILVESTC